MSFNQQPRPPPPSNLFEQAPPLPPSHMFGAWSAFPQNHPDNHEFLGQYGSVVDHPEVLQTHKRPRQSQDNLPNFPPMPFNPRMTNPPPPIPFNPRMTNPPPPGRGGGGGGTGHIFYKTRLCVKFADGKYCRNGDSCNFAHGHDDLRLPPSNWQELVGGGGKELGTGRFDEEHRRNHSNRICNRYYNGEECPYGEKCVFLHERPPPTPSFFDDGQFQRAIIGDPSNQGKTDGYISSDTNNKAPVHWKSKPGERNQFDHVRPGSHASHSHNEAVDTMVKSCVIQSKPFAACDPIAVAGNPSIKRKEKDDDNASRWKLNKKINRIYADWLDDLSPPRNVTFDAEA